MTTASASRVTTAMPMRVAAGVAGGLIGGVVFGVLMQMMDMLPMVAMLVGSDSMAVGWLVHLAISAFIGVTFAVLLGKWATGIAVSVALGMGYGIIWWVLGGLILMPAKLGMGVFTLNTMAWQSLMGHLIYGALLGAAYALILPRLRRR